MKQTIGNLYALSQKDRTALVNEALRALNNGMDEEDFKNGIGWQEWMNDFTESEDGEAATEEECKTIDEVIYEAWEEAEAIYATEPEPYEYIYGKEILDRVSGFTVKVLGRHGDNGYIVEGRETEEDEWTRGIITAGEVENLVKINWRR